MDTYMVYAHYTLDTNELFYIGVGTTKNNRHNVKSKWTRNSVWHEIVAKQGYTVKVLAEDFSCREEAVKEEIRLQLLHEPRACLVYGDRKNKIVLPATRVTMGEAQKGNKNCLGFRHSEESKAKISKALIGNTYSLGCKHSEESKVKMSKAQKGRIVSDETRVKLSKAGMGRKHLDETKLKMSKAALKKAVINCKGQRFDSAKKAGEDLGIHATSITAVLKGRLKSAGKYPCGQRITWSYYERT